MKEIRCKRGEIVLVDDADYEELSRHSWNALHYKGHAYAQRAQYDPATKKPVVILMHRWLMNAEKGVRIEHINNNGLDNRRENLAIHVAGKRTRPYKAKVYKARAYRDRPTRPKTLDFYTPERIAKYRESQRAKAKTPEARERRRIAASRAVKKAGGPAAVRAKQPPEKLAARDAVNLAILKGHIQKPERCEQCGTKPKTTRRLHAHHEDYSKPLSVEWLCSACHGQRHLKKDDAYYAAIRLGIIQPPPTIVEYMI